MRPSGVLIVGVLAAAVCVRLGFWQVSRLHQRQAFRALVESRMKEPPVQVTGRFAFQINTLAGPDAVAYQHGVARGVFDFSRQVVVVARTVDEVPAVYVVTPLLLADGQAVLVERGWVPSPDAYTAHLDSLTEPDTAEVKGILLVVTAAQDVGAGDSTWPAHVQLDDASRLARRYPYRLLPWVLRRTEAPGGVPSALRLIPAPAIDNGPHLSYAIQWFSFALIAVVGSIVLYQKQRALTLPSRAPNLASEERPSPGESR